MPGTLLDLYRKPLEASPAWISGGILPKGSYLLLGGPPKIGKSFLMLDMGHHLVTGGRLWGLEYQVVESCPVLLVEGELGLFTLRERIQERYKVLGTEPPENFFYLSKPPDFYLDTRIGAEKLTKAVEQAKAGVVLVDPISRFLLGNENENTDMAKLFRSLDRVMEAAPGLSICLSHHHKKEPDHHDQPIDPLSPNRFRGASLFYGAVDTVICFQRIPAQEKDEWWRLRTRAELRTAKEPELGVLVLKEGGLVSPAPKKSLQPAGWR